MDQLVAQAPIRINGVVLIAIQRVRCEASQAFGAHCIDAAVEPRALVVHDGASWRACDLDGRPLEVASMLTEVAGLSELVEREPE